MARSGRAACTVMGDLAAIATTRTAPTIRPSNAVCARCHAQGKFAVEAHSHHQPGLRGWRRVACHMPTRAYMVVHERHDHSIRIPPPRPVGVH